MGMRSLQSGNPRRKRSFTLSSFQTPTYEQQSAESDGTAADERSHLRKAAAWQWYSRGVGAVVVPTKRPTPGAGGNEAFRGLVQPPAADTRKAVSRFKAEASARTSLPGASATTLPAGLSPLYDEVELSGLKTQMVEFMQRVQKKESKQKAAKTLHTHPASSAPAGNYGSTQHLHPPAKGSGVHRANSACVEGSGFRRPMKSALQRLFRKVKLTISFSKNNSEAVQKAEAPPDELAEPDDVQCHYHHYIHHHHHHYHFGGPRPEEAEFIRRRRHSQSSGIRPRKPSLIWEETTEEEEVESPLSAYIPRRRRHSDSVFAEYIAMKKIDFEGAEWPDKEPVKIAGLQLPRRYSSERFTSEHEAPYVGKYAEFEEQWHGADIKSRRLHSTENFSERDEEENARWRMWPATEETKGRGGEENGGGVYKLGGARAAYGFARRRNSESLSVTSRRRKENVERTFGGSARYDTEEKNGLRGGSFRCWQGTLSRT